MTSGISICSPDIAARPAPWSDARSALPGA